METKRFVDDFWEEIKNNYTPYNSDNIELGVVYGPEELEDGKSENIFLLVKSKPNIKIEIEFYTPEIRTKIIDKWRYKDKHIFEIEIIPNVAFGGKFDFIIDIERIYFPGDIIRIKKNNSKHKIKMITPDGKLILDNEKIVNKNEVYYYDSEIHDSISFKDRVMNVFRKFKL